MHLNSGLMRRFICTRVSSWFMAGMAFHWPINMAAGVECLAGVSLTPRGMGVSQPNDVIPKTGDIRHHTEDGRLHCQQRVFWITFRGDLKARRLQRASGCWHRAVNPLMCHIVPVAFCCSLFCRAGIRIGGPDNLREHLLHASPSGVLWSLESLPVCFWRWIFPVQSLRWRSREQNALIKLSRCLWAKLLSWKIDPPIFYASKHLETHDAEHSQ